MKRNFARDTLARRRAIRENLPPQIFRLGSSNAVHAPGIVVWARSLALTDADKAARIVADCWSIPLWAAQDLVTGRSTYQVQGETVVFPLN